jgi:hypothetical protein
MSKENLGLQRGRISPKAVEKIASIAGASCRTPVFEYKKSLALCVLCGGP